MPILTDKATDGDISSLENLLHDIYNNILPPTPENITNNELVEDLLTGVNCIYRSMLDHHENSNKSLTNRATRTINQFYIDLITRAILTNNIICTQILINQAPFCCKIEFYYPSIHTPEIGIQINSQEYSISVSDTKITTQFLYGFIELLQKQKAKKIDRNLTKADSGLLPSSMSNWMGSFKDCCPGKSLLVDNDSGQKNMKAH